MNEGNYNSTSPSNINSRPPHSYPPTFSEIAELMSVKSKFGAGGEYVPDWKPKVPAYLTTPLTHDNSHS